MRRLCIGTCALFSLSIWLTSVAQADPRDDARIHLRRANQLSASGSCGQAIPEFTAAYQVLADPAILFNRAECYRKMSEWKSALADYRKFLVDLPTAPNRSTVEARIAELERTLAPPPPEAPHAPPMPTPVPGAKPMPSFDEVPGQVPAPEIRDLGRSVTGVGIVEAAESPPPPAPGLSGWLWVGLGVVALAAGGLGIWYARDQSRTSIPPSNLGNYRF